MRVSRLPPTCGGILDLVGIFDVGGSSRSGGCGVLWGLTWEDGHYDDVGRHQPSESARIQRFRVAGGRGELRQPVQVTDKEWMCDR